MRNEYTSPEVIEVGKAQDVILGQKPGSSDDVGQNQIAPESDLDE
jgi:hypothetical protein